MCTCKCGQIPPSFLCISVTFLLPVMLGQCTTTDTKVQQPRLLGISVLSRDWGLVILDWMKCILKYTPSDMALITQFVQLYPSEKEDKFLFNLMQVTTLLWNIGTQWKVFVPDLRGAENKMPNNLYKCNRKKSKENWCSHMSIRK